MENFQINRATLIGLIAIAISTFIFLFPELLFLKNQQDILTGTILIHYSIALIYCIYIKAEKVCTKMNFFSHNRETATLTGVLFWISCFSLNREFPLFHQSTDWLSGLISVCIVTLLAEVFFTFRNKYSQITYALLSGVTSILLLYYTAYLIPFWGIGLIGMILLGLGGHVFVPFLMLLNQITLIKKLCNTSYTAIAYCLGAGVPIIGVIIFSILFSNAHKNFQLIAKKATKQTDVPAWVYISQHTPKSALNSLVLRKELVYPYFFWSFMDDVPSTRKGQEKKHNPALIIADMLNSNHKKDNNLSINERLNIISADYEEHNDEVERLWRGTDLSTSKIKTEVELFPTYRIAYTEKTFDIKNNTKNTWQNQQEAIYTFHMPEGTVVTSLSLWVNGVEEKGILTSKKKAEKAYNTIVGRERRDPSLVTWKEGNMITVRVFPCTPEENRKVKIGFTSPVAIRNNNIYYQALLFEGPSTSDATEEIIIHNANNFEAVQIDFDNKNGVLQYNGNFIESWNLVNKAPKLSTEAFCFDNDCYNIQPLATKHRQTENVYIDITSDWTKKEVKKLLEASPDRKLHYFSADNIKTITNYDDIDDALKYGNSIRFSLFPFYNITTQHNVVITKGGHYSVKWSELGKSGFETNLRQWIKDGNTANVVFIGTELTPYQKGLLEFKALNLTQLSLDKTSQYLQQKSVPFPIKRPNTINLYQSELSILKTDKKTHPFSKAPDHLMRLYAYNEIMEQAIKLDNKDSSNLEQLVDIAQTAYVVSPVSSLIVLETKQDYETHDIKDKKNSLHNASISSSGSAPEPHEWMMIIMALLVAGFSLYKKLNFSFLN